MLNTESDAVQLIERYRSLIAQLDAATTEPRKAELRTQAQRLRDEWKEFQGEDSLVEMCFGEPVDNVSGVRVDAASSSPHSHLAANPVRSRADRK